MAATLGISRSALQRWITQSKNHQLETVNNPLSPTMTAKEKRPEDWSLEKRLKIIIEADSLSNEATSELCRDRVEKQRRERSYERLFLAGNTAERTLIRE